MQRLSYLTKHSVTVIPEDMWGTWSVEKVSESVQLLHLTSTKQLIKHYLQETGAMRHMGIKELLKRQVQQVKYKSEKQTRYKELKTEEERNVENVQTSF